MLRNSDSLPAANLFAGDLGNLNTDSWTGTAGLGQRLPWLGASYDVSFNAVRTTTNNPIASFTPSVTSTLQAVFSQPFLRDFKTDPARAQVEVTEKGREIADIQLRERVTQARLEAEAAYWVLVAARAWVQQCAADLRSARADEPRARGRRAVAAAGSVSMRRGCAAA